MIQETSSEEAQSDRVKEGWNPNSMQAIFGLPDTFSKSFASPEWEAIGDELAVSKCNYDSDPMREGNWVGDLGICESHTRWNRKILTFCILQNSKAVTLCCD